VKAAVLAFVIASSCMRPPGVGPDDSCAPEATRCHENEAQVCDSRGRWGSFLDCNELANAAGERFVCVEQDGDSTCRPEAP